MKRFAILIFLTFVLNASVLACANSGTGSSNGEALSATTQAQRTASSLENFQKELPKILSPACEGQGVAGTAAYRDDGSFHPFVWISNKNWMWQPEWRAGFPSRSWLPQSLDETQLVVCESELELVIEECAYYGGIITRYAYESTTRVIEALTGKLVAENVFQGTLPRECLETERSTLTALYGEHVPSNQLLFWLSDFVGEPE